MPKTVKLPAVEIEVPRRVRVVYVHPDLYYGDEKTIGLQLAAVVINNGHRDLQTFTIAYPTLAEAESAKSEMLLSLEKGPFTLIQTSV